MFTTYPKYSTYRTLRLASPLMQGEDVYALQTALNEYGVQVGAADGILGPHTSQGIRDAQSRLKVTVDGLAGGVTQMFLVRELCVPSQAEYGLPPGLAFGQCSHESSCRVGNYSPIRLDGSYDAGVAQRNTRYTSPEVGFDVARSVEALAQNTRKYYDKFAGVKEISRRWGLACGAWNAPAFACYIARQEGATTISRSETAQPTPEQKQTLELYIISAISYAKF